LRLVSVLLVLLATAPDLAAQDAAETSDPVFPASDDKTSRQAQQSICLLVESAAHANELPTEFFVRLIWQESRFRAGAIGPRTRTGKHALGIAQFMPGTSSMPSQTRAYVLAVTGNSVEEWAAGRDVKSKSDGVSCPMLMARLRQPPTTFLGALQQRVVAGAIQPWGAILGANQSRSEILDRYSALQRKFAAALDGLDPIVFERTRGGLPRYQVRVGAESRQVANDICKKIHLAGGDCVVLRNPGS